MAADFSEMAGLLGFPLDAIAFARFETYRQRILGAGFNLTAARDHQRIETRHFLESLALGRLLLDRGVLTPSTPALDIGSGAGFPGLPLKIVLPDLPISLLEANGKKSGFLQDMVDELDLDGVEVLLGRAETLGQDPAQRARYDLVLARAVAPLPVLLEYALPFLTVGGTLAATKGSAAQSEIAASGAALEELGGELVDSMAFEPPEAMHQTLLLVRKARTTPARYPRRAGVPAQRPL